jgi:hypothetical protein
MDYAEQVKTGTVGSSFTFADYRNLNRKPPKDKPKPETNSTSTGTAETSGNNAASEDTKSSLRVRGLNVRECET